MELAITHLETPFKRTCVACGAPLPKRARRYCSLKCKDQMVWVLGLSNGLLKTFSVRYATFSFTKDHIILDVLPSWSPVVSRFSTTRTPGQKPAHDLKRLILSSGKEWYGLLKNRHSKSSASLRMLNENHRKDIDPGNLVPKTLTKPRLTRKEKEYMRLLELEEEELFSELIFKKIRHSYRKRAKVYHPDMGGDAETFKLLVEAHNHMLTWSTRPKYHMKRSLEHCWSYDSLTNKWSPPLGKMV